MGAVQDPYLTLFIGSNIRNHLHIFSQSGLFKRQSVFQLPGSFDNPDTKAFPYVFQRIFISVFLIHSSVFRFLFHAAGNNTVDQSIAEEVLFVNVFLKCPVQLPGLNMPVHTMQQFLSVVINQLTA